MTPLHLILGLVLFLALAAAGWALMPAGSDADAIKRAKGLTVTGRADRLREARALARQPEERRKQIVTQLKNTEKETRAHRLSLTTRIQRAGLNIDLKTFWIFSGIAAVIGFLVGLFVTKQIFLAPVFAFATGFGLPRWLLNMLSDRREKAFTEEFANAIDVLVRGIKSGLPVHDCFRIIAKESSAPLGPEFQTLIENMSVGMSLDQAFDKMYARMPTAELRFFTIVLNIQQKAGGNLAEAMSNLSGVLRARKMMREKAKALSGEAVASASIIGVLPPSLMLALYFLSPAYIGGLFTDPRGQLMLAGGVLWMGIGIFVMRKMIDFKM